MHTLRHARTLARLVLAWFVLSLGVAIASPVANPQQIELVCSGSGAMKVLVKAGEGVQEVSTHTLDCPLCAHIASPPPVATRVTGLVSPRAHVPLPPAAAPHARLTAAPLPARGPPAFA